jgi:hypothetical protein
VSPVIFPSTTDVEKEAATIHRHEREARDEPIEELNQKKIIFSLCQLKKQPIAH